MTTEETILYNLGKSDGPNPSDLRLSLATNPDGRQWRERSVNGISGLVVHQELGWSSVEDVAIYHTGRSSHLYAGGVESIAYTFAIRRDGQICLCNDISKATWSHGYRARPGDENAEFMAVMLEGHFRADGHESAKAGEPTAEQMMSLLNLWMKCKEHWEWDNKSLYGHYHFGKEFCPGDTLKGIIEAIRRG